MDFVVEAQGIELRLGEKRIYKNLTAVVPAKGCTVLLGPSGTGKSTLLRLLSGQLLSHSLLQISGQLRIQGVSAIESTCENAPALVEQKADLLMSSVWEALIGEWTRRAELTQLEQKAELARVLEDWGQTELLQYTGQTMLSLAAEQRKRIAIVRKALSNAPLLMIDEPTANMKVEEAAKIVELVKAISRQMPVLVVTHHLKQARDMADHIILLASGVLQEQSDATSFFKAPVTESGRQFLLTGSCPEQPMEMEEDSHSLLLELGADACSLAQSSSVQVAESCGAFQGLETDALTASAAPVAQAHGGFGSSKIDSTLSLSTALSSFSRAIQEQELEHTLPDGSVLSRTRDVPVPRPRSLAIRGRGPRGLTWILDGILAGTPLPGVLIQRSSDLSDLRDAGITHLISLTEKPFPAEIAAEYGISCSALPMPDMACPTLDAAIALCQWMDELIAAEHCIAVHCHAGLGRTGTILCLYWIWQSKAVVSADQAIQFIRSKNAGMIQSVSQEAFIGNFIDECFHSSRQMTCRL